MSFPPIAIVGRACVFPGALTPEQLWEVVAQGRDLVSSVDAGRWRVAPSDVLCGPDDDPRDRAWTDRGGYVRGFESVWDPSGFALPTAELEGLDPLFLWVLHCAREALCDAGDPRQGAVPRPRVGAVLGNLSFPSPGMNRYAESVWLGALGSDRASAPSPRERFMSSGPAALLEQALGLRPGGFCLDGACASSLYAIDLACTQLHDGTADLMLAGAVNRADDLFLHVGFSALQALSRSGRSRPFHAEADGLLPAEGAGVIALERLEDARRNGRVIHGVIRGIGLSNDGRGRGFLAPTEEGQRRALQAAYERAGISPHEISLLECHATGTVLGDATELRSSAAIFEGHADLPIASLKSNLGHMITAAGVAGLIKVLEAMRHGERPASLHVDTLNPALAEGPFRVLREHESWPASKPRLAGISAFGFGGNNAHLIVGEDDPGLRSRARSVAGPREPLAVIGLGAIVGKAASVEALGQALREGTSLVQPAEGQGRPAGARMGELAIPLAGLCFPPRDLERAIAQQLAVLGAAREATDSAPPLPRERTGVYVGMETDPEVCRWGLRWRLPQRMRDAGAEAPASWLRDTRDAIAPALGAEEVVGTMPNIPANRINRQLDLGGPSFAVSAGEASGRVALELAARALEEGRLDAAVVGAVDLSCQPVHRAAIEALEGEGGDPPGDAAVVLVLRRLADAIADADPVLAILEASDTPSSSSTEGEDLRARLGRCWAAGDLRDVAVAIIEVGERDPPQGVPVPARPGGRGFVVRPSTLPPRSVPQRLHRFAARDVTGLCARLSSLEVGGHGVCRVAILASDDAQLGTRAERALRHLREGAATGPGVFARLEPIGGDTAFVFAGAGAAYQGMGAALLRRLPSIDVALRTHSPVLAREFARPWDSARGPEPLQRLWSSSYLSQAHAELSARWLSLRPDAVIGYSSGESNALFATGIWSDHDAMIEQCRSGGLFSNEIGGELRAVTRAWGHEAAWETFTVLGSVDEIVSAAEAMPRVHVSIIHHDEECVVAGEPSACAALRKRLSSTSWVRLRYDLAVHVPELSQVAKPWLALHRRRVTPPSTMLRVYSGARASAYEPSEEACAQAILGQADRRLDFRAVIERAYADGVRVFVEHGPQGSCGRWIRAILGDRDAVIVAFDRKGGGVEVVTEAIAALWAAGVSLEAKALLEALGASSPPSRVGLLRRPAHPTPLRSSDLQPLPSTPELQSMPAAPELPAVGSIPPPPLQAALAPPVETPPPPPPRPAALGLTIADVMQAQLAELGARQRTYVEQQAALQRQFLQTQAEATAVLVAAYRGQPPKPVATPLAVEIPPPPRPEPPTARVSPEGVPGPRGPTFDRAALEVHAGGAISKIYGPAFAGQDHFERQVRMPLPPLLLADRVTGLDAEPMSMKLGTIWTETDVRDDAWYLHVGHMPAGIMIEAGQADLMLISYLGVDAENKGQRSYRLLGCTLTYHGSPPRVGETLCFDIHLDGHAKQGDTRLMFFHYDCHIAGEVRLSVRQGQAGFFTDAELADSDGCLWRPEDQEIVAQPRLDPPAIETSSSFTAAQVEAFAEGRPWACFGDALLETHCHTRTPTIQRGRMQLLHRVDLFEPRGGPWKRGYLRATTPIASDDWFFAGHFLNDPCMPGTLMLEGCLQAMAFHLAGLGYTLDRDGWRFEPVPEVAIALSCRGQVTPSSKMLTYEVFVEEVIAGPEPTLYADMLCTVDGLKAFHARRVGLRLVPAWPLDEGHVLLERESEVAGRAIARAGDFVFDRRSMLACASGRPTEAFGPIYARFDGPQAVPRLPNPPYNFISRAMQIEGGVGEMLEGGSVEVEFDLDPEAWYFAENASRTMPFAVLLEVALQPCGWLASYMGCALTVDDPLMFRNLDGHGTQLREVGPDDGIVRTRVRNTQLSVTASMIIVGFDVECSVAEERVYSMSTVFGFFPASAFDNQAGLPTTEEQRALLEVGAGEAPRALEVARPGGPRLAASMLMMLDRITHFDPSGGAAGLGCARGQKDVDPSEWFFAAHFFQDPVQPGSLGIEAMLQLLQWCMRELGLHEGIAEPRFEPIGLDQEITWKYRGQVVPSNRSIATTLEITEIDHDERGALALADASLWVDGKQIYRATGVGMRIVSGGACHGRTIPLSLDTHPWLCDHRPTFTVPAMPMMSMVDLLAGAARKDERLSGLRDVRVKGWLVVHSATEGQLRVEREGEQVRLVLEESGSEPREVATARLCIGRYGDRPDALPPLEGPATPLPYDDGSIFHGPAFQRMEQLRCTEGGASSTLRVEGEIPIGSLAPALLDAATHGIPHDRLQQWEARIDETKVAYPAWIPELDLYGPTPTEGTLRCEVRYRGLVGSADYPSFEIQLIGERGVWCRLILVEACFPKGRLGGATAPLRRAFLRDRVFVPGLRLSTQVGEETHLLASEVQGSDWLPGTVAAIYGTAEPEEIARKEHIAAAHELHPRLIPAALPLTRWSLQTSTSGAEIIIRGDARGQLKLDPVREFWTRWLGQEDWPVEDLYYGLLQRFLRRVVITDPDAFEALRGRSALYLANHQVGVESLLFSIVASALTEIPTVTLAKVEHKQTWLGQLIEHCFSYPGIRDPELITFFDRSDPSSLKHVLKDLGARMKTEGRSMMVHVEGTRARSCASPLETLSGAFVDMALALDAPVVPIRFVGGLPREPAESRLEFPLGMGQQDLWIGRAIGPETLAAMTYGERRQAVAQAINALGPGHEHEQPHPGDRAFEAEVQRWQTRRGVSLGHATLYRVLAEQDEPNEITRRLLEAKDAAALANDDSPQGRWLYRLAQWLKG